MTLLVVNMEKLMDSVQTVRAMLKDGDKANPAL